MVNSLENSTTKTYSKLEFTIYLHNLSITHKDVTRVAHKWCQSNQLISYPTANPHQIQYECKTAQLSKTNSNSNQANLNHIKSELKSNRIKFELKPFRETNNLKNFSIIRKIL